MADEDQGSRAAGAGSPVDDRRVRTGLRSLIDEMMTQLRAAAGHDAWSAEERARAEADLARIMSQVRERAISGPHGDV